jgi:hypothetical protein
MTPYSTWEQLNTVLDAAHHATLSEVLERIVTDCGTTASDSYETVS